MIEVYESSLEAIINKMVESIVHKFKGKTNKRTIIIGIDGRCGSGKTTIANRISNVLEANCFHMDDFYLPIIMRTPERMSQAGGNVHYERFLDTVIMPSVNEQSVNYQIYDCAHQTLGPARVYEQKKWVVVEGAYALHPELNSYYDYRIFVTHSADRQRERILKRNGEQKLYEFELRWIPLEEQYILEKKPEAICDLYIDTSNAW